MTEQDVREIVRKELTEAARDNQEALDVLESTDGIQSAMTLPNAPGMVITFDWGGTIEIQAAGDELNLVLRR